MLTAAGVLIVTVVPAAAAGTAWAAATVPVTARDAVVLALLLALEIGAVEAVRMARPRQRHRLTPVAVVAGALLLAPAAAAVLPLVGRLYRSRRLVPPGSADPPRRVAYSVAATTLACLAVWQLRQWAVGGAPAVAGGLPLVLLALLVYALVDCGLGAAMALTEALGSGQRRPGGLDANLLEQATLALGGLTAAAVTATPWLAPMVLPAVFVIHRAVLVPQLTEDAHIDGKTGLLNAATWYEQAAVDVAAARPDDAPRAVLVIDLDHFKAVNDTYGHLAGDTVPAAVAAVAAAVRGSVRSRDLVGASVRRRGRRPVGGLRVSIGVGMQRSGGHPAGRGNLNELLQLADEALYAAKRGGRDQVRMSALTRTRVG